jgi:hypothetical protein
MLDFVAVVTQFLTEIPFKFIVKRDKESVNTQFYFPEKQISIQCIHLADYQQNNQIESASEHRTIRIWEDVWKAKPEIVQSRIRAIFGISQRIPARMTKVERIDKPTADRFLIQNHLQASVSAKLKYGLFLPPQYFRILKNRPIDQSPLLVAVATFSGSKPIERDGELFRSFELIRFANLLNCTVVGGFDKLLKNFIKEQNPDDIMSYADRDWSDGNSYEQTGFELIGTTSPQDFWVNGHSFERITSRQKELQNNHGDFIEVHNFGNLKYLLNLKKNKDKN